MASSGILRRAALVRTDVSEEPSTPFIKVTRIVELGTTLAVNSNRRKLQRNTKPQILHRAMLFILLVRTSDSAVIFSYVIFIHSCRIYFADSTVSGRIETQKVMTLNRNNAQVQLNSLNAPETAIP
jgi:hypothetical protein